MADLGQTEQASRDKTGQASSSRDKTGQASSSRDDRGQIILIAAFILAVSFVVLALVVNSAIFTENLATRDDVPGSHDALQYRGEIQQNVGTHIEAVNDNNSLALSGAEDSIPNVSAQGGRQQSSLGRLVNVSYVTDTNGEKVALDSADNFESDGTDNNWTVASGVSDTRNIQINVTDKSVLEDEDLIAVPTESFNPFRISVSDSAEDHFWNLTIFQNGTLGGDVKVRVVQNDTSAGTVTASCVRDISSPFTVDVTAGLINDEPCHALDTLQNGTEMWFANNVSGSYSIEFQNGQNIKGTYSLIVDDGATFTAGNFGSAPNDPYHTDAIYSMTVKYAYYTPAVVYETEIEVAPGEAPP